MTTASSKSTINDVARIAGVSKRTVSRVINNSSLVSGETKSKIEQVIKEIGFVPNSRARGLASQRSYLLGLIYSDSTLFIDDVQRGILNICAKLGYELVVHPFDNHEGDAVDNIKQFLGRSKVDGVIILPLASEDNDIIAALKAMDCNYVRFTSDMVDDPCRLIVSDYGPAITDMTNHLVADGHSRIGFISGPKGNVSSEKRQQAFHSALAKHGLELPAELIAEGAFTFESGAEGARKLLSLPQRPTAIFAANDEMAMASIQVAQNMGLKVPADLSIVGFDGSRLASHFIPSLTTVKRPIRDMSELATRKLLAFIDEGPEAAAKLDTIVVPKLIRRDSTAAAPV